LGTAIGRHKIFEMFLYPPGRHKRITVKDLSFLASFLDGGDFVTNIVTNAPPAVILGKYIFTLIIYISVNTTIQ